MKTLNIMLSNLSGRVIPIGYEGENLYTRIRINCIEVFSEYPDATVSMVVSSPVGDMYPAVVEKSGVMVVWDITDSVLSSNGSGECQLTFTEGDVVRKSVVFGISINRSLIASGEAPEPVQEWIDKAEQTAQEIAENAAMLAKQDIVESYGEIAPAIIETASGAIAYFSDGADGMLVKKMTVDIAPVQDLHGYDSPWPAGGGKNITSYDTDYVAPTGYTGSATIFTMSLTEGVTYTFSCKQSENVATSTRNTLAVKPEEGSTTYESSATNYNPANLRHILTFTASITGNHLFMYWGHTLSTSVTLSEWQVEVGSSFTGYAPYENSCPITGWTKADVKRTGENVLENDFESGSIDIITGLPGANANYKRSKNFVLVKPNTTYYLKSSSNVFMKFYDADKVQTTPGAWDVNNKSNIEFTTNSKTEYLKVIFPVAMDESDFCINYPSTDTQYHAYSGSTAEYEFPSEAGTVYGGTLTIHQDGSGELVVKRWYKKTTWGEGGQATSPTDGFIRKRYEMGISNKYPSTIPQICNVAPYAAAFNQFYLHFYVNDDSNAFVFLPENTPSDLEIEISGELATPVTYQLTNQQVIALLKGSNNVWADTGNVALEYPADTKLYIAGKIAEIQALILENISNS